jgi:hypothetical protein
MKMWWDFSKSLCKQYQDSLFSKTENKSNSQQYQLQVSKSSRWWDSKRRKRSILQRFSLKPIKKKKRRILTLKLMNFHTVWSGSTSKEDPTSQNICSKQSMTWERPTRRSLRSESYNSSCCIKKIDFSGWNTSTWASIYSTSQVFWLSPSFRWKITKWFFFG